MKIESSQIENLCDFKDVRQGECFYYDGTLFMRTFREPGITININAVSLNTGKLVELSDVKRVMAVECVVRTP